MQFKLLMRFESYAELRLYFLNHKIDYLANSWWSGIRRGFATQILCLKLAPNLPHVGFSGCHPGGIYTIIQLNIYYYFIFHSQSNQRQKQEYAHLPSPLGAQYHFSAWIGVHHNHHSHLPMVFWFGKCCNQ